jgi:hydrocephalus-inducing protein
MDSPYFSVRRVLAAGAKEDTKVATGMEVAFVVTFRPESRDDYACDLVVCTEREKFVVPVMAVGASAALDFPDVVDFSGVAVRLEKRQTVFVRNVGSKAARFSLSAQQPFAVSPAAGELAPGETLQVAVLFMPPGLGRFEGELEIQYDSGRSVYAQLVGSGHELDVGLSQGVVSLLSTFVTKSSQKTFKIVNNSDTAIAFAIKQRPSVEQDAAATTQRLATLVAPRVGRGRGGADGGEADGSASEDEDAILASAGAQLTRRLARAQRDALLDAHVFTDRTFAASPAEGTVWPRSELEVVITFSPDHAREYEVTAFVELVGRSERLPLVLKGRGLGPAAVFTYDVLDVGDSWVNTLHMYEVELQNRGKIDVEFRLAPPTTSFGSRFAFEPSVGRLSGGQIQPIKVRRRCGEGGAGRREAWACAGTGGKAVAQRGPAGWAMDQQRACGALGGVFARGSRRAGVGGRVWGAAAARLLVRDGRASVRARRSSCCPTCWARSTRRSAGASRAAARR